MKRINPTGVNNKEGLGVDFLTQDQMQMIHNATLEILNTTGIKVESVEAARVFADGGAKVQYLHDYALVKFPSYLLEQCLAWAARPLVFYGRTRDKDFAAGFRSVGFSTFGECVKVIDLETRKIRKSQKKDVADITKVCDYLDEIVVLDRPCCSQDKPSVTQPLHNLEAMLHNTSKPVFIAAVNAENCRRMVEMAAAVSGDMEKFRERPFLNIFVCPTSPLTMVKDCCEIIMTAASLGTGIAILPMALAGATAPATLAGTIVSHNAEMMAALVLAQLSQKGARCICCSLSTIMDLKLMVGAVGSPELGLLSAALTQMARFYNLPSWVGAGLSDSKVPDAQVGYEFATNALLAALSGANIVYGAGALESALTIDYAKLIMDAEAMHHIRKIINGVQITPESLALDIIHEVGPGGEFLTHEHTFSHLKEQSQVSVFNRQTRTAWEAAGRKDAAEIAYEKAKQILENHRVAPLPQGSAEEVCRIIDEYEKELHLKKKH